LIQQILCKISTTDILSHCAYGRLLLSKTENAILRKDLETAASCLREWEAKNVQPSDCDLHVIRLKNTVFGRVSRYQGEFLHAQACLIPCLRAIPKETSRYHVMHHLADVYCELHLPEKAEQLLKDGIEDLKSRGKQCSKAFRCLLLPWAEACLQQRRFEEARAAFSQLGGIFNGIVGHDVPDQLDHVRSIFGQVRISYQESRWSEALEASQMGFNLM
jgi:tetratricopeptide (TPR) repeat protein